MSRSHKKEPVFKDPNNSDGKRKANRRMRRKTKQSIHSEDEVMPKLKEVLNSYDVVDFKTVGYKDDPESIKRLKRK